jgi:hypothetical protein
MPAPYPHNHRRELLAEALQLSRLLLNSSDVDAEVLQRRQARLRDLQTELQPYAHPIQRDRLPLTQIPLVVRQAFVRALVLSARYHRMGGHHWRGTLDSPTLRQYQIEPVHALSMNGAIARWTAAFDLPAETIDQLSQEIATIDQQLAEQERIITAVLENVGLSIAPEKPLEIVQSAMLRLFQHLFGAVPVPVAALHCLHTRTQIFFCLDYDGLQLADPALWQPLPVSHQEAIARFLEQIGQFSFEKFNRFPIFGACDPQQIDLDWCDCLSQQLAIPSSRIVQVLLRSVSIIPTQKAEAFLVHDIWGHYWQSLLTQFESDYSILADCDEPLRAGETAYTPSGPIACRELFWVDGQQVWLDEERSRLFFHGEVQQRLGLLFTHLIGELVADVAEFKFIWDHPTMSDRLPSSSVFKGLPAKLDLSLADIDFLFLRVLQSLLTVNLSVMTPSLLEEELLADWDIEQSVESLELQTNLKIAIAHLYQIFMEEYQRDYLPTVAGQEGIFTKTVSNLLYLQNAINHLYTDAIARDSKSFQDVLMIFVAVYCSSDSYAEFWNIDDAIAQYFLPCWTAVMDVDAASAPSGN